MITNVCYLAIVGLAIGTENDSRRYWAQLNGGHVAELSADEYTEIEDYLIVKNRIEMETVSQMDPNAGMDDETSRELKMKYGKSHE